MHLAQKTPRPKTVKRHGIVFAGTGDSYICDLICELLPIPKQRKTESAFDFAHGALWESVIRLLDKKGLLDEKQFCLPREYKFSEAIILIGIQQTLFELEISKRGISMGIIDTPYAHGCGGAYALGALIAFKDYNCFPHHIVRFIPQEHELISKMKLAVQIAGNLSPGCDEEVDIVKGD